MGFDWYALGNKPAKTFEFRCQCCGEVHRGSPSFGYEKPPAYFAIPEAERADRIKIDADTCEINDDEFYIRALLEIPVEGADEPFSWGAWVSQSAESFERYMQTYNQDQGGEGSFGWLTVTMPGYVRTEAGEDWEHLACDVKWQAQGQRPLIEPHECDHPLYHDAVNGISWDRAIELARLVMHPEE